MFLALVVTALTSLYVASSPAILSVVLGNRAVFFGLMIAELAVVFVLRRFFVTIINKNKYEEQ